MVEVRKKVSYDADGFELTFEPIENSINIDKTSKGFQVTYLTPDENPENPIEEWDGNGKFYHWDNNDEKAKYEELLGYDSDTGEKKPDNPLAVRIDKYEHSGVAYSVETEGMQDQFDTSHSWAVWFPDESAMEDIKRFKSKEKQRKRAVEIARSACELFNQWANGEVYTIVKEVFDSKKNPIDFDTVGGYFGYEEAEKELKIWRPAKANKTSSKKKLDKVI